MKISIITVCFNSEKTIGDTIRSVVTQTHGDIEYIVIDGGSSDETREIVSSFGEGVARFVSEPDNGLYDAMNKGLALATGDVVGFLHSDDMLADQHVISCIASSLTTNNTDSVYGDIQYVDQEDTGKILTFRTSGNYHRYKFRFGWSPPHPTFYMKRTFYQKYGGFDTTFQIAADYDALLRYMIKYKITSVYDPRIRVRMRVGGVSNRTMKNVRQKWAEDYRAMQKNGFGNPITHFLKTMRPVAHFYRSPKYLFE